MEQFWRFWVFKSRLRGISWHLETNISLFIPLKLSGIKGMASWKHAGSVRLVSHSALATVRPQPLLPGVLFGFNCGNNKLPPPGVTSHTSPVCSGLSRARRWLASHWSLRASGSLSLVKTVQWSSVFIQQKLDMCACRLEQIIKPRKRFMKTRSVIIIIECKWDFSVWPALLLVWKGLNNYSSSNHLWLHQSRQSSNRQVIMRKNARIM